MISSLKSKFDSYACRAIYLSADKLAVYHWVKGRLGSSYLFDVTEDGQNYFKRYLQETPNIPVYFLVDVNEEEYHQESIPHVFGSDRKSLIERKKIRLFRDTPYFHVDFQGRQDGGRRDDNILLMGLTNPEILAPWLALLDGLKVPLAGIYSLPHLINDILDVFPEPAEHMLIVSLQSISGLRQTYFHENKLKLSRLVNMPRYGTVSYSTYINDEVERIHRYLNGMHLVPEEKQLNIYFLANNELLNELRKMCGDTFTERYHYLDVNTLASETGLGRNITTPFSDQLFVYHLLKRKLKNFYATSSDTRYFQLGNMRKMMLATSVFMILGGIMWGGLNFMEGMVHKQQSESAMKKTEFYNARYAIAREKLPATPISPQDLQLVVGIAKSLEEYKATPVVMLRLLSQGLNRYPSVQIDKLAWAASTDPNLGLDDDKKNDDSQAVLGLSNIDTTEDYMYYQIATMKGHLSPFDGDYRAALAVIDELVTTYRNLPAVHDVSIISLPLDISSEASLKGATDSNPGQANFSIKIVLGISHET